MARICDAAATSGAVADDIVVGQPCSTEYSAKRRIQDATAKTSVTNAIATTATAALGSYGLVAGDGAVDQRYSTVLDWGIKYATAKTSELTADDVGSYGVVAGDGLSVRNRWPALAMPPPTVAVLPVTVHLFRIAVPWLAIPPPLLLGRFAKL